MGSRRDTEDLILKLEEAAEGCTTEVTLSVELFSSALEGVRRLETALDTRPSLVRRLNEKITQLEAEVEQLRRSSTVDELERKVQRLEAELKASYASKNFSLRAGLLDIEKSYRTFIASNDDVQALWDEITLLLLVSEKDPAAAAAPGSIRGGTHSDKVSTARRPFASRYPELMGKTADAAAAVRSVCGGHLSPPLPGSGSRRNCHSRNISSSSFLNGIETEVAVGGEPGGDEGRGQLRAAAGEGEGFVQQQVQKYAPDPDNPAIIPTFQFLGNIQSPGVGGPSGAPHQAQSLSGDVTDFSDGLPSPSVHDGFGAGGAAGAEVAAEGALRRRHSSHSGSRELDSPETTLMADQPVAAGLAGRSGQRQRSFTGRHRIPTALTAPAGLRRTSATGIPLMDLPTVPPGYVPPPVQVSEVIAVLENEQAKLQTTPSVVLPPAAAAKALPSTSVGASHGRPSSRSLGRDMSQLPPSVAPASAVKPVAVRLHVSEEDSVHVSISRSSVVHPLASSSSSSRSVGGQKHSLAAAGTPTSSASLAAPTSDFSSRKKRQRRQSAMPSWLVPFRGDFAGIFRTSFDVNGGRAVAASPRGGHVVAEGSRDDGAEADVHGDATGGESEVDELEDEDESEVLLESGEDDISGQRAVEDLLFGASASILGPSRPRRSWGPAGRRGRRNGGTDSSSAAIKIGGGRGTPSDLVGFLGADAEWYSGEDGAGASPFFTEGVEGAALPYRLLDSSVKYVQIYMKRRSRERSALEQFALCAAELRRAHNTFSSMLPSAASSLTATTAAATVVTRSSGTAESNLALDGAASAALPSAAQIFRLTGVHAPRRLTAAPVQACEPETSALLAVGETAVSESPEGAAPAAVPARGTGEAEEGGVGRDTRSASASDTPPATAAENNTNDWRRRQEYSSLQQTLLLLEASAAALLRSHEATSPGAKPVGDQLSHVYPGDGSIAAEHVRLQRTLDLLALPSPLPASSAAITAAGQTTEDLGSALLPVPLMSSGGLEPSLAELRIRTSSWLTSLVSRGSFSDPSTGPLRIGGSVAPSTEGARLVVTGDDDNNDTHAAYGTAQWIVVQLAALIRDAEKFRRWLEVIGKDDIDVEFVDEEGTGVSICRSGGATNSGSLPAGTEGTPGLPFQPRARLAGGEGVTAVGDASITLTIVGDGDGVALTTDAEPPSGVYTVVPRLLSGHVGVAASSGEVVDRCDPSSFHGAAGGRRYRTVDSADLMALLTTLCERLLVLTLMAEDIVDALEDSKDRRERRQDVACRGIMQVVLRLLGSLMVSKAPPDRRASVLPPPPLSASTNDMNEHDSTSTATAGDRHKEEPPGAAAAAAAATGGSTSRTADITLEHECIDALVGRSKRSSWPTREHDGSWIQDAAAEVLCKLVAGAYHVSSAPPPRRPGKRAAAAATTEPDAAKRSHHPSSSATVSFDGCALAPSAPKSGPPIASVGVEGQGGTKIEATDAKRHGPHEMVPPSPSAAETSDAPSASVGDEALTDGQLSSRPAGVSEKEESSSPAGDSDGDGNGEGGEKGEASFASARIQEEATETTRTAAAKQSDASAEEPAARSGVESAAASNADADADAAFVPQVEQKQTAVWEVKEQRTEVHPITCVSSASFKNRGESGVENVVARNDADADTATASAAAPVSGVAVVATHAVNLPSPAVGVSSSPRPAQRSSAAQQTEIQPFEEDDDSRVHVSGSGSRNVDLPPAPPPVATDSSIVRPAAPPQRGGINSINGSLSSSRSLQAAFANFAAASEPHAAGTADSPRILIHPDVAEMLNTRLKQELERRVESEARIHELEEAMEELRSSSVRDTRDLDELTVDLVDTKVKLAELQGEYMQVFQALRKALSHEKGMMARMEEMERVLVMGAHRAAVEDLSFPEEISSSSTSFSAATATATAAAAAGDLDSAVIMMKPLPQAEARRKVSHGSRGPGSPRISKVVLSSSSGANGPSLSEVDGSGSGARGGAGEVLLPVDSVP